MGQLNNNELPQKYKAFVDRCIDQQKPPIVIYEELRKKGFEWPVEEIVIYVENYHKSILGESFKEYSEKYREIQNSYPNALMNQVLTETTEESRKLTYLQLLELDVLRVEKYIQDLSAGREPPLISIRQLKELIKLKQTVVDSVFKLTEVKRAIDEANHSAQTAFKQANSIPMDEFSNYLKSLSDPDRHIALETLNFLMTQRSNNAGF